MEFGYRFVCGRGITSDQTCLCVQKNPCSTTHTYICLLKNWCKSHLDGPRTDTASIGSTHATPHPPQKGSGENVSIEDIQHLKLFTVLYYILYHMLRCIDVQYKPYKFLYA